MDRLTAWQEMAMAFGKDLTGLAEQSGLSWQALHAGFSGLVFMALAGGVVAFTRRRQDLFSGFSVGWAFALFLSATGLLMLTDAVAPAATREWVRSAQVLTAPLALLLMAGFLLRIRGLEEYEDSEARQATLTAELRQNRSQLAELRAQNAELARLRDEAIGENERLAAQRQAAAQRAEARRIREEHSGLYTRAHFVERLREEFERANREGEQPMPLFIGFQGLDALAEEAREALIARAGRIVREDLRLPDLACRFSERELLVVPCETDTRGAAALARRLHRRLNRGLAQASASGRGAPSLVFAVLDFEVNLVRFEDYLEACELSTADVRKQTANRLTRLPARFAEPT